MHRFSGNSALRTIGDGLIDWWCPRDQEHRRKDKRAWKSQFSILFVEKTLDINYILSSSKRSKLKGEKVFKYEGLRSAL